MTAWSDNDDLWHAYLRFGDLAARREAATGEAGQLVDLLGVPSGSAVLDLCCGIGRHSLALARRGYRVTAVDRFEPFLVLARAAAAEADLNVELVWDDMRTFRRPGAFDLAISLFTSFGYFHDDAEEAAVLRNLFDSLRPGGRLVIDVAGKEVIARIFRTSMVVRRQLADGEAVMIDEPRVADDWHHIASTWTFLWPDGSRQQFDLKCRMYAATELKGLLSDAGFIDIKAFGSLEAAPYDHAAKRLVVTASRP